MRKFHIEILLALLLILCSCSPVPNAPQENAEQSAASSRAISSESDSSSEPLPRARIDENAPFIRGEREYLLTEDLLAVATPWDIVFKNAETLEETGLIIRAEQMGGEENYFAGIAYHPELGFVVPATHDGVDCVAYFTENGELRAISDIVGVDTAGTYPIWDDISSRPIHQRNMNLPMRLEVIDIGFPVLFWYSSYTAYFYNTADHMFWEMEQYDTIIDGDSEFMIYTSSLFGVRDLPRGMANALALEFFNGKLKDYFLFDCRDFPIDIHIPPYAESTYIDGVYQRRQYTEQMDEASSGEKPEPIYTLTLDLNNHSWAWEYDTKAEYLRSTSVEGDWVVAASKDGRYLVSDALADEVGDGHFGYWAVFDTKNGSANYLCGTGPFPFAGQNVVFLNNNKIGVVFNDAVILYDANIAEKLDFSLDLSFGSYTGEQFYNQPISLCANESLTRFALLYLKKDANIFWTEDKYTHRAALFDADGTLLCDVETDIPMFRKMYTTYHPTIELSKDNILTVINPEDEEEIFQIDFNQQ